MPVDYCPARRRSNCSIAGLGEQAACPDVQPGREGCEARVGEQRLGQGNNHGSQEAVFHSSAADAVEAAREAVHELGDRGDDVRLRQ
eukprot:1642397-Pleurochrysis_carterae.AAC.1